MACAIASSVAVSQACSARTMSGFVCMSADTAAFEGECFRAQPFLLLDALADHLFVHIDAGDARRDRENVVEVMVNREREVTRPAAAIENLQFAAEVAEAPRRRGREGVA